MSFQKVKQMFKNSWPRWPPFSSWPLSFKDMLFLKCTQTKMQNCQRKFYTKEWLNSSKSVKIVTAQVLLFVEIKVNIKYRSNEEWWWRMLIINQIRTILWRPPILRSLLSFFKFCPTPSPHFPVTSNPHTHCSFCFPVSLAEWVITPHLMIIYLMIIMILIYLMITWIYTCQTLVP